MTAQRHAKIIINVNIHATTTNSTAMTAIGMVGRRREMPVTVGQRDAAPDLGGPFVHGDRTDRRLALACGDVPGDATLRLFRVCKPGCADLGWSVERAP